MAKANQTKTELPVIGKIGTCEVVSYNGFPCIRLNDKTLMGTSKIKAVLANEAACKAFLAQYDKPKAVVTPITAATDVATIEARIAELTALTESLKAAKNNAGRVDPLAKAA